MSLWTRLTDWEANGEVRISIHDFGAALGEYERGQATVDQIQEAFELTQQERQQLINWYTQTYQGNYTREEVEDVLLLTSPSGFVSGPGVAYTNAQGKARLGM